MSAIKKGLLGVLDLVRKNKPQAPPQGQQQAQAGPQPQPQPTRWQPGVMPQQAQPQPQPTQWQPGLVPQQAQPQPQPTQWQPGVMPQQAQPAPAQAQPLPQPQPVQVQAPVQQPPQAQPQPQLDQQAVQQMVDRAEAAARKAEAAGLDLGGTRDAKRQEVVDLAQAGQLDPARDKATAFEKLVDGALAWPGRAGDRDKARKQGEFLKSGGDPTADALLGDLKAAEDEATAGHYAEAVDLLGPAIQAITDRAAEWKLLRQHAVEMTKLKPRLNLAYSDIPGRGVDGHALATQWQAVVTAHTACPDAPATTGSGAIPAVDLANRRSALTGALNALTRAYGSQTLSAGPQKNAQTAWGQKEGAALDAQFAPLFGKVKYVRPRTVQQETLLKDFHAMPTGGSTWAQLLDRKVAKAAKAEELLAAVANPTQIADERAWFGAFGKVRDRIEAAQKLTGDTEPPETKTAKAAFDPLWTEVDTLLKGTAPDRFTICLGKLTALTAAADLVLKKRVDAVAAQVDGIGAATPGATSADPAVPATNAQRAQRAVAASQVMPEELRTVILRQLPLEKKLAILEGVRADGGPPHFTETGTPGTSGYSNNADHPERKAQRDLYAALDLDPAFVAAEKEQRKKVVEELLKDKEGMQRARDEWPTMSDADRLKVMQKAMAAHCKTMGFDEPKNPGTGPDRGKPIVIKDVGRPSNNGSYDEGEDAITVNKTGKLYGDFELMMDLIFHENSHNMQAKVAARLSLPDTDPNKLTKTNTDPPYTQALMWAANSLGSHGYKGYVKGAEDYAAYQKQPEEDHSWQAGPKTARLLMKELAK